MIKILLIEDNPGDARLIEEMLKESTVEFKLVMEGALSSGISRLKNEGLDVILLDMNLPDSMGIDTLLGIKKHSQNLPIIVLTGLKDESLGITAVKEGAQDYLIKGEVTGSMLKRFISYAIERKKNEEEREKLIRQLQDALAKVKQLSGMLPICASCKKIKDDKGYWNQVEVYITEHSEALFSHGICPECFKKLYPKYYAEDKSNSKK